MIIYYPKRNYIRASGYMQAHVMLFVLRSGSLGPE